MQVHLGQIEAAYKKANCNFLMTRNVWPSVAATSGLDRWTDTAPGTGPPAWPSPRRWA